MVSGIVTTSGIVDGGSGAGGGSLPITGGTITGSLTVSDDLSIGTPPENILTVTPGAAATNPITLHQSGNGGFLINGSGSSSDGNLALLTLNHNTTTPAVAPPGTMLSLVGREGNFFNPSLDLLGSGGGVSYPALVLRKNSGTIAVPAPVAASQIIGMVNFVGYTGSAYSSGGIISCTSSGTWAAGNYPTNLRFSVTKTGSTTPAVAVVIENTGNVVVGTGTDDGITKLQVVGKGSFTDVLTAPTAVAGTNTTQVATTAFVASAVATGTGAYLPLTGGTLTGPLIVGTGANNALTITPGSSGINQVAFTQSGVVGYTFDGAITATVANLSAVAFETDNNTAATTAYAARVAGYAATSLPDANTTLTAAQTSGRVVNLAGTLTAQRTVTVPVAGNRKSWVFRNSTTGGFNVVVTAPGGGSYAIPPNTAAEFYTDGSLLIATHSLLPNSALRIGDGVRNAVLVTAGTALTNAATIASTGSGGIQFTSDVSVANLTVTGTVTLPAAAKTMPVVFPFGGKPASGAIVNVPMAFSVTVGVSLVGSMAFASTRATSNTVFTLNKVSPTNVVTQLGLLTMGSGSNMMAGASGTGGSLGLGDTLQLVAPIAQDATLADIGITILCTRV